MIHNVTSATDSVLRSYLGSARATAYIPTPSNVDNAEERFRIELKNAAREIAEVADDAAADRLATAVSADGHTAGEMVVAVVGDDDVTTWDIADDGPLEVVGGPLPALGRLLAERQTWVPHAVVRIDKVGADLTIVADRGVEEDLSAEGSDLHVTKVGAGGWSQRRFQQSAEEQWDNNVDVVVDRLLGAIEDTAVDLIVVTGDDRMTNLFTEEFGKRRPDLAEMIIDVDAGSRAEDGSTDAVDDAVDSAVRHEAARRRVEAQGLVLDAVGQGEGVTGRTDVLEALFEGRVDTLLVHLASADGVTAHLGGEPQQVAADSGTLHALNLEATRVPLVDAALSGAAATGAAVVILADAVAEVTDGLAASLRG